MYHVLEITERIETRVPMQGKAPVTIPEKGRWFLFEAFAQGIHKIWAKNETFVRFKLYLKVQIRVNHSYCDKT